MPDANEDTSNLTWKCGLVRPISDMDNYSAQHWSDVHDIVVDTLAEAGFDTRLVSEADDVGVIHGRIVRNLYENDLVVCDVSGRNANVMFELGMRLAFDKPTVIIKDDITNFAFDASPMEHVPYPRDLRYNSMLIFKEQLTRKAVATVKAPKEANYQSFLQHFGPIRVPTFEHQEIPSEQYIVEELREIRASIARVAANTAKPPMVKPSIVSTVRRKNISLDGFTPNQIAEIVKEVAVLKDVQSVELTEIDNKVHMQVSALQNGTIRSVVLQGGIDKILERMRDKSSA